MDRLRGHYTGCARSWASHVVSVGAGDPIHDWHYILGHFGWLGYDHALARLTHFLATLSIVAAVALGSWLCAGMQRLPAPTEAFPAE